MVVVQVLHKGGVKGVGKFQIHHFAPIESYNWWVSLAPRHLIRQTRSQHKGRAKRGNLTLYNLT
ncbi:hypothetical protein E2C01_098129 [Portunus trituberculatus]|uniref:Uncharacterized protein n=1 Tax=Portunus trituberculatus TaxID=210409 RepID=A0A5B7K6A9_PORTR|nr:hypothetical protein [Portunus trituberculatus]